MIAGGRSRTALGQAVERVGHALVEAPPLGAGGLLVGFEQAPGLMVQPVGDAGARDLVELAVQVHHPVVAVPHAHSAPGALALMLACSVVAVAVGRPAACLAGELLGPHRLGLGQQLGVGSDGTGAGGLHRGGQLSGVGLRHPSGFNEVAHAGNIAQRLRGLDVASCVVPRKTRSRREHLGAAVAMTLPRRHRRRSRGLSGGDDPCRGPQNRQRLTHLGARRGAFVDLRQRLLGSGFGPSGGFDQHEHSMPHPCDIINHLQAFFDILS